MSTSTKWIIGIAAGLILLSLILPFIFQAIYPTTGYGMMGWNRAPMMGGYGHGFMSFGMFFVWLIPLGLLVFIVLGIAALVKYLMK